MSLPLLLLLLVPLLLPMAPEVLLLPVKKYNLDRERGSGISNENEGRFTLGSILVTVGEE